MFVSRIDIRIQWGDCDPAGIVFYPRYFEYFNIGTDFLLERAFGRKKIEWIALYGIVGIPMVDTRARFVAPSRYGDDIVLESEVTGLRKSSFDITHRIFKNEKLAVEGFETRVWTGRDAADPSRLMGLPMPEEVVRLMKGVSTGGD